MYLCFSNLYPHDLPVGNPSALSMLADIREGQGTIETLHHAILLFECLQEIDVLRIKYWSRRKEMAQNRLAGILI